METTELSNNNYNIIINLYSKF